MENEAEREEEAFEQRSPVEDDQVEEGILTENDTDVQPDEAQEEEEFDQDAVHPEEAMPEMTQTIVPLKASVDDIPEGVDGDGKIVGKRNYSITKSTTPRSTTSEPERGRRRTKFSEAERSERSDTLSYGSDPRFTLKKIEIPLRDSKSPKKIKRRATPATKSLLSEDGHLKLLQKASFATTRSSPESRTEVKKRRSSAVRFNDEIAHGKTDSGQSKLRPHTGGAEQRSSVRFIADPDFILAEAEQRQAAGSPTPLSRKSSVTFEATSMPDISILSPQKSSRDRFSFSGLPPEKGVWTFHREPEGLALKFKTEDSEVSVDGEVAKREIGSNETVLNLEFKRPSTHPFAQKKSVNRQIMMMQESSSERNLHARFGGEASVDVDREGSAYFPLGRHQAISELGREFGSACSTVASTDESMYKMSIMRGSTRELLQGLLPGMEEEFDTDVPTLGSAEGLPHVLDVDNPLMDKFQAILKKHLLSQINRLTNQIQDLNHEFKAVGEESKKIADFVYKEERFVAKQEEDIESFRLKTQEITVKRTALEKELDESAPQNETFISNVNQVKKHENELRKEKELIADLVHKLKEMESQKEAELKFSISESDNAKREKAKLADEKLKQDFILWKLEKEVMKLGRDMETSLQTTVGLQEEIKCVSGLLSNAELDLNAKSNENKLLQKSIAESLLCINIRDKELTIAKEKVSDAKNHWLMMVNSINTYAKDVDKEMSRNEKNTALRKQLTENLESLRNKVKKKTTQKIELESNLETLEKYLEESESNLAELKKIGQSLKKEEKRLRDEHLRQEQIFNSKKREYIGKLSKHKKDKNLVHNIEEMIDNLAEKNQAQEARISESENILAKLMVESEDGKLLVNKNDLEMHTKQNEIIAREQELRSMDVKRKKLRDRVLNLTSRIRMKNQKIKELESKLINEDESSGTFSEQSATARKLKKLEKIHAELEKDAESLANEWLHIQNQVLHLKEQRGHQVHEINITRKHNLTMENSKIRHELMLKKMQSQIVKCNKETGREEKVLSRWHQAAFLLNQKTENMKLQIVDIQNLFAGILKDAECEAVVLQKEHCELANLIQDMTEQLSNSHKDLLQWEKRWNLAIEAKERIDKEKEAGGEVATMRLEIHRMEVRYNQLKKAQEKMLNDLELCISRRDQIIDNADAREKRSRIQGKQFSRVQLKRKIQEMKNKVHQLVRNRKDILNEMESARQMDLQLRKEYSLIKDSVEALKHGLEQLEKQIEEGQVHQHSCLETTVMRQRKCKFLEELKFGKYRCLIKTPDAQLEELHRLEDELGFLYQVVESLKDNFPQLHLQLQQIENTVTTDSIYLQKCDEEDKAETNGTEEG